MITVNDKLEAKDYPYGYKKTSAFFSIEFKKGKGFRSIFQTLNPKTGRLNAEKKGTYNDIMYLKETDGFIQAHSINMNGFDRLNAGFEFMYNNFGLFTEEQVKSIASTMLVLTAVSAKASCIYAGIDFDKLKPLIDGQTDVIKSIIKTGENNFGAIKFDFEAIEKLKPENYQPFKVVNQY